MMQHLEEDAELYALGLTERERSDEIEAHLTQCAECRARVVAAESAAASLAAALPPMPHRSSAAPALRSAWFGGLAAAAALVFAATAALEGSAAHAASARLVATDTALVAIASSHFGHTTLRSDRGVIAKAIYARDGAWCYIVGDHVPAGSHVVMFHGATPRDAGVLADGTASTLFVRAPGHVDRVEIVAGDRIVASGAPVY